MTLANNVTVDYGYDAASQLTSLTYKQGTTTLGDLSYEHDRLGRRVGVGGSYARVSLPQALSTTAHNDANQLTARGTQTFTYDDSGNLTSDGSNSYTWNARNQLTSIAGSTQASFQYDAFGRRTQRTINNQTTAYLYDGSDAVQETSGSTLANLIVGGVDEVFSRTESGVAKTLLQDGLGSTLGILNSAGASETSFTYEPFGKTSETGAQASHSGQYTGRENDGTGLYYYRARYYSPQLQRFISQDPIGFAGGDVNLYAYVKNDAANYTDPSGKWLTPDTALDIGFMAYDIYKLATSDRKDNTELWLDLGADFAGLLIPGATGLGALRKVGRAAGHADDVIDARRAFPSNPDNLLPDLPRDAKGYIYPNDYTRIRPEQHPVMPGETFNPRHHGQHYHVDIRRDPNISFNNKKNCTKMKPPSYTPGSGTGFLPGESFPQ